MMCTHIFDHVWSTGRSQIARCCWVWAPALVLAASGGGESAGWRLVAERMRALLGANREWREMEGWESRTIQIRPGVTGVGGKSRGETERVRMMGKCGYPQPCTVPGVRS